MNYVEYGKENSDIIILLHGGEMCIRDRYNTQDMKKFKEAKNMGPYVPDICVKKTDGGGYVTVKSEGKLIPLNLSLIHIYQKIHC